MNCLKACFVDDFQVNLGLLLNTILILGDHSRLSEASTRGVVYKNIF